MKAHLENFQFVILGNTGLHTFQIRHITTKSVSTVSLLSATIDSKLKFKEDVNNIIKKSISEIILSKKTTKVSILRKSQNCCLFNDRT